MRMRRVRAVLVNAPLERSESNSWASVDTSGNQYCYRSDISIIFIEISIFLTTLLIHILQKC